MHCTTTYFSCSLGLHHVWKSSEPPRLQLTIITAATPSRLDALEAQCSSWGGPLAAAVYVALLQPLGEHSGQQQALSEAHKVLVREAETQLQALFDRVEARTRSGGCQLLVLLLYEVGGSNQGF